MGAFRCPFWFTFLTRKTCTVLVRCYNRVMSKRVTVYMRVSTDEQDAANQEPEVMQLAKARGDVVTVYTEQGSAQKHRPEFERMLKDAKRGKFDVLVIWAIDRFGRSMHGNLADAVTLDTAGVRLVSVKESWLDTTGPTRNLLLAIFSWVAEQELARLVERTKAGIDKARRHGTKSGKRIGRPRIQVDVDQALALLGAKTSVRQTAKMMSVSLGTLQRALARKSAA